MTEKTITISERGLMDLIKQSHDLLTQGKPIDGLLPGDNGELDEPPLMSGYEGPYEDDELDEEIKEIRRLDMIRKSIP